MKRNIFKIIALIFLLLVLVIFLNTKKTEAYTSEFFDFSSIKELDKKYCYGTMFWTDKTEIIPISVPYISTPEADKLTDAYKAYGAEDNQIIKLKITNCAIDEDSELCDVVVTVAPVEYLKGFNNKSRWTYYIFTGDEEKNFDNSGKILTNILIIKESLNIENQSISVIKPGELICFALDTVYTESKLTLDYYKAGTDTRANINGVAGFITNINVPLGYHTETAKLDYSKLLCNSNEAVAPNYSARIFYDTHSTLIEKSEKENAIYSKGPYQGKNLKGDSCFIVEDEVAKYEILYGGTYCGIGFCFISPYKYTTPSPNVFVDKNYVYENEEYNVKVTQYVPSNYYPNILKFISTNDFYTSFVLKGKINGLKYKEFDLSQAKVFNASGNDVSSMFNIELNDNMVTATLKSEYLSSENFYNNFYTLNLPLRYIENDEDKVQKDFDIDGFSNISGEEKKGGFVETMVLFDIQVKKNWNDQNDKFGIRPVRINVDIIK